MTCGSDWHPRSPFGNCERQGEVEQPHLLGSARCECLTSRSLNHVLGWVSRGTGESLPNSLSRNLRRMASAWRGNADAEIGIADQHSSTLGKLTAHPGERPIAERLIAVDIAFRPVNVSRRRPQLAPRCGRFLRARNRHWRPCYRLFHDAKVIRKCGDLLDNLSALRKPGPSNTAAPRPLSGTR
jgi:hypothetical protein